jgi:hypothetical protein
MAPAQFRQHHVTVPSPQLRVQPCRGECEWREAPARDRRRVEELLLFACRGCGTQWLRSLAWTPIDADGTIPEEVRQEAARRDSGLTTGPGAGAAGNADR